MVMLRALFAQANDAHAIRYWLQNGAVLWYHLNFYFAWNFRLPATVITDSLSPRARFADYRSVTIANQIMKIYFPNILYWSYQILHPIPSFQKLMRSSTKMR